MLQYEELRLSLLESEKPLAELKESIGYDSMKEEIKKLEADLKYAEGFLKRRRKGSGTTSRTPRKSHSAPAN